MESFYRLIGEGRELTAAQMCIRAIIIFIVTLLLIRLSGRRSFGMRSPFDNVISILLGAVLSRAITGSSPFFAVIISCTLITAVHRGCAWICLYSKRFDELVKGRGKYIYQDGKIQTHHMKRFLVTEDDLMESVRQEANKDELKEVKSAYVEKNGEISVIK